MHGPMVMMPHKLEYRINSALLLTPTMLFLTPVSWWHSSCGLFSLFRPPPGGWPSEK